MLNDDLNVVCVLILGKTSMPCKCMCARHMYVGTLASGIGRRTRKYQQFAFFKLKGLV